MRFSQTSTTASIAFCPPVGISFTFQVVNRTMTKISAATIQVQIIEFVTGKGPTWNIVNADWETMERVAAASGAAGGAGATAPGAGLFVNASAAWLFAAGKTAKNKQARIMMPNDFT